MEFNLIHLIIVFILFVLALFIIIGIPVLIVVIIAKFFIKDKCNHEWHEWEVIDNEPCDVFLARCCEHCDETETKDYWNS